MLNSLKKQLTELAQDPQEHFYLKVFQCLNSKDCRESSNELQKFVLMLPEMIRQVYAWRSMPSMKPEIKKLNHFMLAYLYDPVNFLPNEPYGLFGYLDDAYFVGSVLHLTVGNMGLQNARYLPSSAELPKDLEPWLNLARQTLPRETKMIDQLINNVLQGREDNIQRLVSVIESAEESSYARN